MKEIWKLVGVVVLVVIILGSICIGAGLLSGADGIRVYTIVNQKFGIEQIVQQYQQQAETIISNFM